MDRAFSGESLPPDLIRGWVRFAEENESLEKAEAVSTWVERLQPDCNETPQ
jgi:hypothetical protein